MAGLAAGLRRRIVAPSLSNDLEELLTPIALLLVAAIIVAVWALLLGTAYVARVTAGRGVGTSLAAVTICYFALAMLALLWLGTGSRGWLSAAGMLAPYATALALSVSARGRRSP